MNETVAVLGNESSMSSLALLDKYPNVKLESCDELIEVLDYVRSGIGTGFLPFWNSHVGEVTHSKVIDSLDDESSQIVEMWPGRIVFSCIGDLGYKLKESDSVASVHVAKIQCSEFIAQHNLDFDKCPSTTKAVEKLNNNPDLHIAFCAKENVNNALHSLLEEDASNPFNFTSFALLVPTGKTPPSEHKISLSLVEMPLFTDNTLDENQHKFFDTVFDVETNHLNDVAKPTFVRSKNSDRINIIFESDTVAGQDIISDETDDIEISTKEVGTLKNAYGPLTNKLLSQSFGLNSDTHDFLKHQGKNTCLFFCPPLGIYIHGFEPEIVETVTKTVIAKHFEKFARGIDVTDEQQCFFDKHYESFQSQSMREFRFLDIRNL